MYLYACLRTGSLGCTTASATRLSAVKKKIFTQRCFTGISQFLAKKTGQEEKICFCCTTQFTWREMAKFLQSFGKAVYMVKAQKPEYIWPWVKPLCKDCVSEEESLRGFILQIFPPLVHSVQLIHCICTNRPKAVSHARLYLFRLQSPRYSTPPPPLPHFLTG